MGSGSFSSPAPSSPFPRGRAWRSRSPQRRSSARHFSPIGVILPRGAPLPSVEELLDFGGMDRGDPGPWRRRLPVHADLPNVAVPDGGRISLPGALLEAPWEIPVAHAEQLRIDLALLFPDGDGDGATPLPDLPGVQRIGEAPVSAAAGVVVDPGAVLDTRKGPIHLGARVRVSPFTWLKGPSLIGADSILLGGTFDSVVCGPVCRLRGEIEESVILGFSNKAHDGYLGHALLGRWVNLGALTTNSDLKNNYGTIRIGGPEGETDTGLLKLGALLGDHVKLGIGGGFPGRKWIPPFSWGSSKGIAPYDLDAFLATAETVTGRRGVGLSAGEREFLSRLWERTHGGDGER